MDGWTEIFTADRIAGPRAIVRAVKLKLCGERKEREGRTWRAFVTRCPRQK